MAGKSEDRAKATAKGRDRARGSRNGRPAQAHHRGRRNAGGDVRGRIVDAALRVIAERGWRCTDIDAVALAAGISRAGFLREFDNLHEVVIAASRRANAAMFEEAANLDSDDPPRERLFAVLMRRFEAAAPERAALKTLMRAAPLDPLLGAVLLRNLAVFAHHALEAAALGARGLVGLARVKALASLVLAPVIRVWLDDDTPDLAHTMAALDRALRRYERLAGRFDPVLASPSSGGIDGDSGPSLSSTR